MLRVCCHICHLRSFIRFLKYTRNSDVQFAEVMEHEIVCCVETRNVCGTLLGKTPWKGTLGM